MNMSVLTGLGVFYLLKLKLYKHWLEEKVDVFLKIFFLIEQINNISGNMLNSLFDSFYM